MNIFKHNIVSEQGEKNLVAYKYVGSDASLLYKHLFSPVAQWLVDKVIPIWLAPNVITLLGFSCTLIPHLLILLMFPNELKGEVPAWLCFLTAIGQFVYINLDNADGKQARKTGSSSPLGLLFDHGCDALNTFISGLSLFTIVQLGNTPLVVMSYSIAMVTFFLATWEEYYVDGLHLPLINGANEGQAGVIGLYILTGFTGTQIWTKEILFLQANEWVVVAFLGMAIVTYYTNFTNVYKKNREKFNNALFNLTTITYIVITMIIVSYFSHTNVVTRHARIFLYFIGFCFGKLVSHLQVAHVAHEEFKQFRKSIWFTLTFINVHTLHGWASEKPLFSEDLVVYVCFIYALLAYAIFVFNIIPQFCHVLKIYVFKIGTRADTEELELRRETDSMEP